MSKLTDPRNPAFWSKAKVKNQIVKLTALFTVAASLQSAALPPRLAPRLAPPKTTLSVQAGSSGSGSAKASSTTYYPPTVNISYPKTNATLAGMVLIQGFALDNAKKPETAIASVTVSVDGKKIANATYGLSKPQVCLTYPGRPGCPNVGFSYNWDTTKYGDGPHTLTITATDSDPTPQSTAVSVAVNVQNQEAVISSFGASSGSIISGQPVTLSWSVSGKPVPELTLAPSIGLLPATSTSITLYPSTSTVYTLTAKNRLATAEASATVIVTPAEPGTFNIGPATLYFSAAASRTPPAPQVIIVNNTVSGSVIKWKAAITGTGAAYCSVSPASGQLTGQSEVTLLASVSVPTKAGNYPCAVTVEDNGSFPTPTNSAVINFNYNVLSKTSTPPPPVTTPPNAPTDLTASATDVSSVNLSWYGGADAKSPTAGFLIYRDGLQLATTSLSFYNDTNLQPGSFHSYAVAAFDAHLNTSAQSGQAYATTFVPPPDNVPANYQVLYQQLQSLISTDASRVQTRANTTSSPVNYSTALSIADINNGTSVYQYCPTPGVSPLAACQVDQDLNSIQALGMNTVMVDIGYPIFDPGFYAFLNAHGQDLPSTTLQSFENYYIALAQDIHNRGMKLVVEGNPMLTVDSTGTNNLDPTGYYESLTWSQYTSLRSAGNLIVAEQIKPDYFIPQSEPQGDADNVINPSIAAELNDPVSDVQMVSQFELDLDNAHIAGLHTAEKIGSGMGTWQPNWQQYLTGLLGIKNLDNIDNHVYYLKLTPSTLDVSMQMIDQAHAAGKQATMAEFWPHKSVIGTESALDIRARDTFDFWAPLDEQFFLTMAQLADYEQLDYLSSFNSSGLFWAYQPFATTPCVPVYPANGANNSACDNQILSAQSVLENQNQSLGILSPLGSSFEADMAEYPGEK